jgi:hypothetical protein
MINRDDYLKAIEIVKEYQKQCYDELEKIEKVLLIDELKDQDLVKILPLAIFNILYVNNKKQLGYTDGFKGNINYPKVFHLCNVSQKELFARRGMGLIRRKFITDLCLRANIQMLP